MTEYREITGKEWKRSLLLIAVLVVLISGAAFVMLPDYVYGWLALVMASVVGIIVIVAREEAGTVYKCPKCEYEFAVSGLKSALSPHGVKKDDEKWMEWKILECPMCHEKLKMYPVKS